MNEEPLQKSVACDSLNIVLWDADGYDSLQ